MPFDLSEGDIVTIFSQYGEPVHVKLVRDKDTGKSKGFAFLKYEDQRSTDLAVDNLGGATVMGRVLRVDHTRYKRREEEGDEDNVAALTGLSEKGSRDNEGDTDSERKHRKIRREVDADNSDVEEKPRPLLKEERELAELMRDHDDEDPMKEYLIQEKKEEVARALESLKASDKRKSSRHNESREHSHRHRHHHRRRRSDDTPRSRETHHRDRELPIDKERSHRDRSESPRRRRERSRRERD